MRVLSVVLLVLSLAGNAGLGFTVHNANNQIMALQESVNQKQTRINGLIEQYNKATAETKEAKQIITGQQDAIGELQDSQEEAQRNLNSYRVQLAQSTKPMSPDMCPVQIDQNDVRFATSNEEVKPALYEAVRNLYIGNIARSTMVPLWKNSKTVFVEINWSTFTSHAVISWRDDNQSIQAIYEVSYACYLYSSDTRDWK
ncbi:MAG: hypothetical protein RI985_2158 [Chloroflexota bacterium]|jgi:seryl-tRNA synthetase